MPRFRTFLTLAVTFTLLSFAAMAQPQAIPLQYFTYGIIVKAPTPGVGLAGVTNPSPGAMNVVATFVAIANFATGTQLSAVASTGQVISGGLVNAPGIFSPRAGPTAPYVYPLTSGQNGSPASLPSGSQVQVTMASPDGSSYSVKTASFVNSVMQSADSNTLTINGTFDTTVPTRVYLGFWPFPFNQINVVSSTQIEVNLHSELIGAFASGTYPVTVLNGLTCDGAVINFRSTVAGN